MEEGLNWFGGPFCYDGQERWQLWFDNPNKAAVLLAELAVLGLMMLFAKGRRKFGWGLVLFCLPSLALVQTFSRGGIVAWAVAVAFVLWRRAREYGWDRRGAIAVGVLVLVFAFSAYLGLSRRMADGFSGDDRSVCNRFEVWSKVPQMVSDAPLGWGLGKAGAAYMNWYQPLDRLERYRTLVSSPLTWFAETGWAGMFVWMTVWSALLHFGAFVGSRTHRWICFSEWLCLGVAGVFSTVMESPWLWLLPMATVLIEGKTFANERWLGLRRCAACGLRVGSLFTVLAFVGVKMFWYDSKVLKSTGWTEYRGACPACWVVSDPDVMGGANYPRVLREEFSQQELITFRFVDDVLKLPKNAEVVAFCGRSKSCGRRGRRRTIWVSPPGGAAVVSGDTVIVGEFSSASACWEAVDAVEVPGAADFIPSWPRELTSVVRNKRLQEEKEELERDKCNSNLTAF